MNKISWINTEKGIYLLINNKSIPINKVAKHYNFEIKNEEDIWILIDAISSAAIEGAIINID